MTLITPRPNLLLPVIHDGQPPSLLRVRDYILHPQSRSVWSGGILERKDAVIANDVHQAKRLFKLPFRLARKSDNQIARKRYIPSSRLNPRYALQIFVTSVESRHGIQN